MERPAGRRGARHSLRAPGCVDLSYEAITFSRPATLSDQVPWAYAAIANTGNDADADTARTLWTAGACPLNAGGRTAAVGDVVQQAEQVMTNLIAALAEAGAAFSVVKSTVYVTSGHREDLTTVRNVVRAAFGDHDAPSTLLGVSVLSRPDQSAEVEAVAIIPRGRTNTPGGPSASPARGKSASS